MKKKLIISAVILLLIAVVYQNAPYGNKEHKGIDVSHHNNINWNSLPKDIRFCYIKATEGKNFRDNKIKRNYDGCVKNDLCIGFYHYFRTNVPAKEQFKNFNTVLTTYRYNLIPAIDVEDIGNDYSDIERQRQILKELIECFYDYYHYYPIVYYGTIFDNARKTISATGNCKKWERTIDFPSFIRNAAITQSKYITIGNEKVDCDYCNLEDVKISTQNK